jgi:hypothetical protein
VPPALLRKCAKCLKKLQPFCIWPKEVVGLNRRRRFGGIWILGLNNRFAPFAGKMNGGVAMRKLCFALVCLAVVLAMAVCFANERRVGIGVSAGGALLRGADDDDVEFEERAKLGPMGQFVIRKAVSDHWSLGLNVGYGWNYDDDSYAYRTNLIPVDLNAIYTLMPDATASPYMSAGFGVVHWDANYRPEGRDLEDQRDWRSSLPKS